MSNARAIFWLSVILLLSLAVFWLQERSGSEGSARAILRGDRLVRAPFEPTVIEIASADGSGVTLERNRGWQLVKPFRAAADERIVLKFLDRLLAAKVVEAVSEAELLRFGSERSDIGLEPVRLSIALSDGRSRQTLSFGNWTPSSNAVYAAVGNSPAVLIADAAFRPETFRPESFRVREIFQRGPESVVSFTIRQTAGRVLSFARTGAFWRVGEKLASAAKVTDFLRLLSSARVVDFKWPSGVANGAVALTDAKLSEYGLDADSAVAVTLRCSDGADTRLAFGSAAEDLTYALVHDGSSVVTVDAALRAAAVQPESSFADTRVFPLGESSVQSFALSQGGSSCIVARGADGLWRLDAPIAAPAEPTVVQAVLGRLLALSSADAAPAGLSVTVNTNGVRLTVSPDRVLGNGRLEDLRARQMVSLDSAGVKRLVVTRGTGLPLAVVRDRENRRWRCENGGSETVDDGAVERLLSALNPLVAARVVALRVTSSEMQRYGLETPYLTVAVDRELEESVRCNILVGAATKGGRYATVGSSDAVFLLSDRIVRILEADLANGK